MKTIDPYRDRESATAMASTITVEAGNREFRIMEVCGGHTIAIFKYGLRDLLPENIRLIGGPGCPVCVTSAGFIDYALELSRRPEIIITGFGDLVRVPGSRSSLQKERGSGADIRVCYSTTEALNIARNNPDREIVFLGIGFETTAPTIAAAVKTAAAESLNNFSILSALKTMPDAMKTLVEAGDVRLDAFICPGHVTVITGMEIYEFLARDYHTPCVATGFEPLDLLQSILMIVRQINEGRSEVENQYRRAVTRTGNEKARRIMDEIFEPVDMPWRGLGIIAGSGLGLRRKYDRFDAVLRFPMELPEVRENRACLCGAIMRGVRNPHDCKLFARGCTPDNPKGPCMVSEEGACATYYKYDGAASPIGREHE